MDYHAVGRRVGIGRIYAVLDVDGDVVDITIDISKSIYIMNNIIRKD